MARGKEKEKQEEEEKEKEEQAGEEEEEQEREETQLTYYIFIELIISKKSMGVLIFHLKFLPKIVSKYFYRGQRDGSAL